MGLLDKFSFLSAFFLLSSQNKLSMEKVKRDNNFLLCDLPNVRPESSKFINTQLRWRKSDKSTEISILSWNILPHRRTLLVFFLSGLFTNVISSLQSYCWQYNWVSGTFFHFIPTTEKRAGRTRMLSIKFNVIVWITFCCLFHISPLAIHWKWECLFLLQAPSSCYTFISD